MQRRVATVLAAVVLALGSSVAWAQTPTPTPTSPSCSVSPCGGTCAVLPPCTPGMACPQYAIKGTCELDASGACSCVASSFPTPPTPAPTFTPSCAGAMCSGFCELCPPCVQFGCEAPCLVGTCELDASGACSCVQFTPPRTSTPTPSPVAPSGCIGDCTDTHVVTVAQLITLVDIALGTLDPSACPQGIPSGVPVNVVVIVQAADNLLGGCPGAPGPTPTVSCPPPPCAFPLIGQCTRNGMSCSCSCVSPTPTPAATFTAPCIPPPTPSPVCGEPGGSACLFGPNCAFEGCFCYTPTPTPTNPTTPQSTSP
jgi:hypothetical protein